VYDAVTGQERSRIVGGNKEEFPSDIKFSSDGKTLYVLANEKPGVMVFDTKTGKAAQTLEHSKSFGPFGRLVVSQKHNLLAAISQDCVVLWDLTNGKQTHLIEHESPRFGSCAFSPDAKVFAIARPWSGLSLYDSTKGKEQHRLHSFFGAISLGFAPDGKTLVASDYDGCITFWDIATGKPVTGHKETEWVSVAFSPDSTKLFSAGRFDPRVIIWDVATGKQLHELQSHARWVDILAVSPNGRWLASAASANNARNDWDIRL
jgi:WD40 repeat protein